jgi:hypothetical protein
MPAEAGPVGQSVAGHKGQLYGLILDFDGYIRQGG